MSSLSNLNFTIVGLGLMGGSLALSLLPHVNRITAVDNDPATLEAALKRGIVQAAALKLEDALHDADLVILATPVSEIIRTVKMLPSLLPDGCSLFDVGSTKGQISDSMDELPETFSAIGGHPMCGREVAGLESAVSDLYEDQTFILCRNKRTTADVEELALALIQAIGAHPLFLSPRVHDRLTAGVSHLPYATAALLIRRAANLAEKDERTWRVSASGFRDSARVAGTDPRVMHDILTTNRRAILRQLLAFQSDLTELVRLLQSGDDAALYEWIASAKRQYSEYLDSKRGV